MIASACRPEIYQKLSQLCIHVGVWDEPVSVSPAAGERVKKKQGFVGCPLDTFLPDVDTFDLRFQFSLVHFILEIRSVSKNKARVNGRFDPLPFFFSVYLTWEYIKLVPYSRCDRIYFGVKKNRLWERPEFFDIC